MTYEDHIERNVVAAQQFDQDDMREDFAAVDKSHAAYMDALDAAEAYCAAHGIAIETFNIDVRARMGLR